MRHINALTAEESKSLLDWFLELVYKGHDLTVRFKWINKNDLGMFSQLTENGDHGGLIRM